MCSLCKPTPNGKRADKSVRAALKVWKAKSCDPNTKCCCAASWGDKHDWSKGPPTRTAPWEPQDFDRWQRRERFTRTPARLVISLHRVGLPADLERARYEAAMRGEWPPIRVGFGGRET